MEVIDDLCALEHCQQHVRTTNRQGHIMTEPLAGPTVVIGHQKRSHVGMPKIRTHLTVLVNSGFTMFRKVLISFASLCLFATLFLYLFYLCNHAVYQRLASDVLSECSIFLNGYRQRSYRAGWFSILRRTLISPIVPRLQQMSRVAPPLVNCRYFSSRWFMFRNFKSMKMCAIILLCLPILN